MFSPRVQPALEGQGVVRFGQIALTEFACETRKDFGISDFRSRNGSVSLHQGSNQERSLFVNEPYNQSDGIEINHRRSCTMAFEVGLHETLTNRTRLNCETVPTTEKQRGKATRKSQNISRKGAKAAKFEQEDIFSLRSWRLGAINSPTLRPQRRGGHTKA
jgi:hypothetical protein